MNQKLRNSIALAALALPAVLPLAAAGDSPGHRRGHVAAYVPERGVVIFGGHGRTVTPPQETPWIWSGSAWSEGKGAGPVPSGRTLTAGAFDSRRKVLVVHGGIEAGSSKRLGDTWEWDGTRWVLSSDTSPGARDHHAMAFDEARGRIVMYGGQREDRTFDVDLWEWDGQRWSRIPAAESVPGPGPRAHHALAYDAVRKVVLLYGGMGADGSYRQDTWAWDGKAWTRLAETGGPGLRARHRLAFDAARGEVLLYGGSKPVTPKVEGRDFVPLGDTWVWNGTAWTERSVSGPGPRSMHALAFDPQRKKVVLTGGTDSSGGPQVWEWDGTAWAAGERPPG